MAEYITKEGMQRLQHKLNELAHERPKVVEQVSIAREQGDLSENAEYHAARERQRHIENEMSHINMRMSKLQIIDTNKIGKDAVRFGAYVNVTELSTDKIMTYRLVGIDEVYDRDDEIVLLSVASPIGKSMIGKKPGQEFIVKAPVGDRKFKVNEIW